MKHRFTIILIALHAVFMPAISQNSLKNNAPDASTAPRCIAAKDLQNTDLFGAWSLLLEGSGKEQITRLQLQRNPEFAESLAGSFMLSDKNFEVFGDVEDGAFELEESANGKDISAIWKGRVTEGSCGATLTIVGTRRVVDGNNNNSNNSDEQNFVMRRPGW